MKTHFGKWHIALTLGGLLAASTLTGCGLMKDEPEDCAVAPKTSVTVKFKYDYTMAGADVFSQEVGGVTLYVFDASQKLVLQRAANYADGIAGAGFAMDITNDLIRKPGEYTMYALAVGNHDGYAATQQTPGMTFTRSAMTDGLSTPASMELTVWRDAAGVVPVIPDGNKDTRVDTTWVTLAPQELVIPEINFNPEGWDEQPADFSAEVTVPLMRVTNHLECIFWLSDFPTALKQSDFTITVNNAHNGNLGITGTPAADSPAMTYQATYMWVDSHRCPDGVTRPAVHAIFGLSRLLADGAEEIVVTNNMEGMNHKKTTVPMVNRLLANGREAYAPLNYSEQQYLDREHNYCLEFPVDDVIPKYVSVSINILSWSKRIQLADL